MAFNFFNYLPVKEIKEFVQGIVQKQVTAVAEKVEEYVTDHILSNEIVKQAIEFVDLVTDEKYDLIDRVYGEEEVEGVLDPYEDESNNNTVAFVDSTLLEVIRTTGVFRVALQNTSSDQYTKQYGVEIRIHVSNKPVNKENGYGDVYKTLHFNSQHFIGQPFNCEGVDQSKVFFLEDASLAESAGYKITKIAIEPKIPEGSDSNITNIQLFSEDLIEVDAYYTAQVEVINNKNFFSSASTIQSDTELAAAETIKLVAGLYGEGKITDSRIEYYWLAEDFSIDSQEPGSDNDSAYLNLRGAGAGWRCLNDYNMVETVIAGSEPVISKVWNAHSPSIELTRVDYAQYFKKYQNKMKCLIKYGDNIIISPVFNIFNYAHENFSIGIVNVDKKNILIQKDEIISLKCIVYEQVGDVVSAFDTTKDIYKFEYQWYNNGIALEAYTSNEIWVRDSVPSGTLEDPKKTYGMGDNNQVSLTCAVIIKRKTSQLDEEGQIIYETVSTEELDEPEVINSALALEVDIKSEQQFKYYISEKNYVYFGKQYTKDKDDNPVWDTEEGYSSTEPGFAWTAAADYEAIFESFDIFPSTLKNNTEYYVYYTQRTQWTQNGAILRTDDWSFPIIARCVIRIDNDWKTIKSGASIDQLNIFNQLTGGGENQGIFYEDRGTPLTIDKDGKPDPDPSVQYYKMDIDKGVITYSSIELDITWNFTEGKEYYVYNTENSAYELNASSYRDDIDYYYISSSEKDENGNPINKYTKCQKNTLNFTAEKCSWPDGLADITVYTNVKEKLFINADYINTGTLRVGEIGKEKFYASIHDGQIKIGGFTVSETSLESQSETDQPFVHLGTDGLEIKNSEGTSILEVRNGTASFKGAITVQQLDEKIVKSTLIQYGVSGSSITEPTTWSSTVPTWTSETYMWQKITTTYSDNSIETKVACIQGSKGLDGVDGQSAIYSKIDSDRGFSFKSSELGKVTLTARVYCGEDEVDPNGQDGIYNWYVVGQSDSIGSGKTLEIDVEEIRGKRVYFTVENITFSGDRTARLDQAILGSMVLGNNS